MLISYDREADALYIRFSSEKPRESMEIDDGIIVDIGGTGEVVGVEILAFSKRNIDLNEIITLTPEKVVPKIIAREVRWLEELGIPSTR